MTTEALNRPEAGQTQATTPPHSVEAEQSLLGSILLDGGAWDRIGSLVAEADLYRHEHRLIFAAIAALRASNREADVVTVYDRLQRLGHIEAMGGLPYLNALAQSVPGAGGAKRYAEIVREKATLRAVIAAADQAREAAFDDQGRSADQVLEVLATAISKLERQQLRRTPRRLAELVPQRLDRVQALSAGEEIGGMATGLPTLDSTLTGGFRPGGVYILAARPSVGKSSLAQWLGLHVAQHHGAVLMLSQEMPEGEVVDRAIAALGHVDYAGLQTGNLDNEGWGRLSDGAELAANLPFWVDDQPALRLRDIRAKARQVRDLKLLIVDYLQLAVGEGDNRTQEVGSVSRGIKALAKDLGVPVLLLSQLSREVEKRASPEPQTSDLRDSGEIEQDADVVMFLWPAKDYDSGARQVGMKVAKNRQGRRDVRWALHFDGSTQRWWESADPLPQPGRGRGGDL